jgi:hypothetical protein
MTIPRDIILIGSEQVHRASMNVQDAADKMLRAANIIEETAVSHQRWAEDFVLRQQASLPVTDSWTRPEPIEFTTREGGSWMNWDMGHVPGALPPPVIHAVKFSDGSIFDTVNGWRP